MFLKIVNGPDPQTLVLLIGHLQIAEIVQPDPHQAHFVMNGMNLNGEFPSIHDAVNHLLTLIYPKQQAPNAPSSASIQ